MPTVTELLLKYNQLGEAAVPLKIIVPLVPPSVNHYVKHTRSGRHYVTAEGKAFKKAVGLFAAGRSVGARRYQLEVTIFLGYDKRGDGDNFWKVIADGLVEARVIRSDSAVDDWILHKRRDWANPRTEIIVRASEEQQQPDSPSPSCSAGGKPSQRAIPSHARVRARVAKRNVPAP